ncbi:hypothetical protein AHAS_Ahas18G0138800 [Arachis hypogaea]
MPYSLYLRSGGDQRPILFTSRGARSTCMLPEDLLGDRSPPQPKDKWQVFGLRMTWLKNRVTHIPPGADADTLCQYARCYLLMLIGVFFFTDKSANLLPLRWLSLLEDFDACRRLSWGSALLSHTYHSLALPELVMSWIYHSEVNQHCQYWDCFGY